MKWKNIIDDARVDDSAHKQQKMLFSYMISAGINFIGNSLRYQTEWFIEKKEQIDEFF